MIREVEILKIDVSTWQSQTTTDCVAEETALHLYLNKSYYATFHCSPTSLKELAVGHVLSTGIAKTINEIQDVNLKGSICRIKLKGNIDFEARLKLSGTQPRVITSACGSSEPYEYSGKIPRIKAGLNVKADVILKCVNRLNFIAETFRKTGGVHVAAIYRDGGELLAFAEDVGRHNAVDKVIGLAALGKGDFGMCFLALSGRLTGDIVLKAARAGLPIVASMAAALDSGIEIAHNTGVTLVGFVRGNRMSIYTSKERISL